MTWHSTNYCSDGIVTGRWYDCWNWKYSHRCGFVRPLRDGRYQAVALGCKDEYEPLGCYEHVESAQKAVEDWVNHRAKLRRVA